MQDCYSKEFRLGPSGPGGLTKKAAGLANGVAGIVGPAVDPDHIPRPDFSQMVPFKPKVSLVTGTLVL